MFKASSFWPGTVASGISQIAYAGSEFGIRNISAMAVPIVSFSLAIDAVFSQIIGSGAVGTFDNELVLVLSTFGPSFTGFSRVNYQYVGVVDRLISSMCRRPPRPVPAR